MNRIAASLFAVFLLPACGSSSEGTPAPEPKEEPRPNEHYNESTELLGVWMTDGCKSLKDPRGGDKTYNVRWGVEFDRETFTYRGELYKDAECKILKGVQHSGKFFYGLGNAHGEGFAFDLWTQKTVDRRQFTIYRIDEVNFQKVLYFGSSTVSTEEARTQNLDRTRPFIKIKKIKR